MIRAGWVATFTFKLPPRPVKFVLQIFQTVMATSIRHLERPLLKCPACDNYLKPFIIGRVTIDICRGACGGIWFDQFELNEIDETGESAAELLKNIERDPNLKVDTGRKRSCPRCEQTRLMRHFFSAKRAVEVDQCPGCDGYWLDAGELEKVQQEMAGRTQEPDSGEAVTSDIIRYVYQMRSALRG